MKIKYVYYILLPAALLFLTLSAFLSSPGSDDGKRNDKIIKFSHSVHSELAECGSCHSKVLQSTSLKDRLLPDHQNCGECHDVEDSDACNTCHIDENFEALTQSKSQLIFSHKEHLEERGLECEQCHKGLTEVDYSFMAVQPRPVMANCYSCHNDKSVASNACESCHISTADLIPGNHRSVNFRKAHKFAAREFNADCIMCHDVNNNSCETCHVANNISTEISQPYTPGNFADDPKVQKLTRVHELNYRFFHGIDARGKSSECQSCHDTEIFCSTCHQADNADFAMSGIVPASHLKQGTFVTFGIGSGGGDHAVLARRDIENCISCHDVQGNDPVCLQCHTDPDGIKGTNNRTHPAGFMRNEEGDWHNDQGSVCYNCHTNASPFGQAGQGFCGYCHGSH